MVNNLKLMNMETTIDIKKGNLLIPKHVFEELKLKLFIKYAAFAPANIEYPIVDIYYVNWDIDNSEYIYVLYDSLYTLNISRFFKKNKDIPKKAIISQDTDVDTIITFKKKEFKLLFKITFQY